MNHLRFISTERLWHIAAEYVLYRIPLSLLIGGSPLTRIEQKILLDRIVKLNQLFSLVTSLRLLGAIAELTHLLKKFQDEASNEAAIATSKTRVKLRTHYTVHKGPILIRTI